MFAQTWRHVLRKAYCLTQRDQGTFLHGKELEGPSWSSRWRHFYAAKHCVTMTWAIRYFSFVSVFSLHCYKRLSWSIRFLLSWFCWLRYFYRVKNCVTITWSINQVFFFLFFFSIVKKDCPELIVFWSADFSDAIIVPNQRHWKVPVRFNGRRLVYFGSV